MSLEAAIQENTSAIRALIATMTKGLPTTGEPSSAVVAPPKTKKEKPPVTVDNAEATAPAADSPAPGATYDEVKNAIVKLSGQKGRDQVVALLSQFDAAKGPDLKPEQFADFLAQANAAMAA